MEVECYANGSRNANIFKVNILIFFPFSVLKDMLKSSNYAKINNQLNTWGNFGIWLDFINKRQEIWLSQEIFYYLATEWTIYNIHKI